jgi:GNAT superfamily N-acetyltransferase
MNPPHNIALEPEPKPGDMSAVVGGLIAFNKLHTGGAVPEHLFAAVRATDGTLAGGLLAATYLGWLQIHTVWLPENLRGLGYGTTLMKLAEDEALRRGCERVFLETYSFQALPFYEKSGYVVFSRLDDFPPGGARYVLTKSLQRKENV